MGEAAVNVSREYRDNTPEVPWAKLAGMRNRLVHAYFDIDPDIVWDTTTQDLPRLSSMDCVRKFDPLVYRHFGSFSILPAGAGDAGALAAARELVESKLDDEVESREVLRESQALSLARIDQEQE